MEKAWYLTNSEIGDLIELGMYLERFQKHLHSSDEGLREAGAKYLTEVYLEQYEKLPEDLKKHFHLDVENLRKNSLEILSKQK